MSSRSKILKTLASSTSIQTVPSSLFWAEENQTSLMSLWKQDYTSCLLCVHAFYLCYLGPVEGLERIGWLRNVFLLQRWSQGCTRWWWDASDGWASRRRWRATRWRGRGRRRRHHATRGWWWRRAQSCKCWHGWRRQRASGRAGGEGRAAWNNSCLPLQKTPGRINMLKMFHSKLNRKIVLVFSWLLLTLENYCLSMTNTL